MKAGRDSEHSFARATRPLFGRRSWIAVNGGRDFGIVQVNELLQFAKLVLKWSVVAFMGGNFLAIGLEIDLDATMRLLRDLSFAVGTVLSYAACRAADRARPGGRSLDGGEAAEALLFAPKVAGMVAKAFTPALPVDSCRSCGRSRMRPLLSCWSRLPCAILKVSLPRSAALR